MSFDFRETPIKAVTEDLDGNTIYIGNGSGDLASVDIRTGTQFYECHISFVCKLFSSYEFFCFFFFLVEMV